MERVNIKEAAEMLGMSEQGVRQLMLRKKADIGLVVDNNYKKTYVIFREKLNRLVGKGNSNDTERIG